MNQIKMIIDIRSKEYIFAAIIFTNTKFNILFRTWSDSNLRDCITYDRDHIFDYLNVINDYSTKKEFKKTYRIK